jgi:ribosomal protein L29
MENITLGLIIGALGASTVIAFIANIWRDTGNSKEKLPEIGKKIEWLEKELGLLKETQATDRLNVATMIGEVRTEFAKINTVLDSILKKLG